MRLRTVKPTCNPISIAAILVGTAAIPASHAGAKSLDRSWSQDGQASYYGNHWVGHRTTSGARFDQNKLTCAHASLPLGTRLLVTADDTGASVVVTVNDRQPDHGNRIIDLSKAAARRLHMLGSGVADVTISPATDTDVRTYDAEQDQEVADAPDDAVPVEAAAYHRHVRHPRHHIRHPVR